jgi:hypothetical protein
MRKATRRSGRNARPVRGKGPLAGPVSQYHPSLAHGAAHRRLCRGKGPSLTVGEKAPARLDGPPTGPLPGRRPAVNDHIVHSTVTSYGTSIRGEAGSSVVMIILPACLPFARPPR